MSNFELIESVLQRAARRFRQARALRGLWRGLLVGAVLWLAALGAYKLIPLPVWILAAAGVAAAISIFLGLILGGFRKVALDETARRVDVHEHFQERLSTALEVANQPDAGEWRELVVTDAARIAQDLDPRRLVQFNLPKTVRWTLALLVLGAGLGFVPEYRSKAHLQKQADQQNIREAGQQLAELTRRSLDHRAPALEPTQKAMDAAAGLGDQLTKATLTRSEALRDLASAADKIKDQLQEFGKDPALKRLEQAARAQSGGDTQAAAGLQKQIESLQKALGNQGTNPDAIEKLKQDLEKLQQAAANALADKSSDGDGERGKLAASLAALASQAEQLGLSSPNLDAAIEALAANQTGLFVKDLEAALTDLEKMNQMAKTLQQLQAQSEKLGSDLGEQLKYGQAEAAQATLQKMVSRLNSAGLTPEQLQKMLEEVSKAVDPASAYGKVADYLKQAGGQMKQGDRPGAAQSLAAAAKELENLMQQMGDAQQLAEMLATMQQASMCIGTGQRWGLCKNPGIGLGGKPGSGVGTWAGDNSGWLYDGRWSELSDNSGLTRPDMDPHGLTDRGDGQVDQSRFTPDKVKGQFSPGGQMPSIALKGVSIKGTSKVQYEEAATTAQSDAQAALSQEKVPRAYQGAVRDYFDDLKK